ncbi:hypothetical protein EHQ94_01975 [Leptospira meyeri]|uniref:hypothetical protein n=1 Tax=Leptospira meyeri TaxID=29508 RepID=UPI0010824FB5|nr:hypothetical protein [Leptospira meyeri]TGM68645.1 hypothetical protein EHQ93_00075 [Leptospira meyeri]TGM72080.1 hypothetical protein EHQ94_01975 [Leptospira meyeri]
MGYIILAIAVVYIIFKAINKKESVSSSPLKEAIPKENFNDEWLLEFWDGTQYYPAWIKNNSNSLWPEVIDALKISEERHDIVLKNEKLFSILVSKKFDGNQIEIEIYYNKEIVCCFTANYMLSTDSHVDWFELESLKFRKDGEWQKLIKKYIDWEKNKSQLSKSNAANELKRMMDKKLE